METDKRYFLEGLFIIGLTLGAAFFFIWLGSAGHRDDQLYRIVFAESVSGLSLGEPVRFQGVDVGSVKRMGIDPADPGRVVVEVKLRKDTPVRTDTRASLKLKGITGVVYIELDGGRPEARSLLAVTPPGRIPEIASEKSSLATVLDQLPVLVEKFAAFENKANQAAGQVADLIAHIRKNPSVLLRGPKNEDANESRPGVVQNARPGRTPGHP